MRRVARRDGSKYRNRRTWFLGRWFDSAGEARRYQELLTWGRAEQMIRNLELQPRFPLHVNGIKIGTYVGDLRYQVAAPSGWVDVVEDYKGMDTLPLARWKQKHMLAEHGITVQEVRDR